MYKQREKPEHAILPTSGALLVTGHLLQPLLELILSLLGNLSIPAGLGSAVGAVELLGSLLLLLAGSHP